MCHPSTLCCTCDCSSFIDNEPPPWGAWPGPSHPEGWQDPARGSSRCLERKETRRKQRGLGKVPTQCKGEARGRAASGREGQSERVWQGRGCSWVLPRRRVLFRPRGSIPVFSVPSAASPPQPAWRDGLQPPAALRREEPALPDAGAVRWKVPFDALCEREGPRGQGLPSCPVPEPRGTPAPFFSLSWR